jgi:hypothetical protein
MTALLTVSCEVVISVSSGMGPGLGKNVGGETSLRPLQTAILQTVESSAAGVDRGDKAR